MTTFAGATKPAYAATLGYEQTLEALLALIGRPVLVLFSGTAGAPFIAGVLSGRLDRGEPDDRLQEILLRDDDATVETLFFHVGSRQTGFILRPDEFESAFWQSPKQLTIHLGACGVTVILHGDLGEALARDEALAPDETRAEEATP